MRRNILLLSALVVLSLPSSASARTWYVAADGSGDAPTIAAAVDSSASGDVILVGPGTHGVLSIFGSGVPLKEGTSLLSEGGPTATFLVPGGSLPQPGIISTGDNCVVSGFTILGSLASALHVGGDYVEVSNNIIDGRHGTSAIGIGGSFASIHHNVCLGVNPGIYLADGFDGADIYNNIILNGIQNSTFCDLTVTIHCNLLNGSVSTCPFRYDNFSGDPMFCGTGNYYLQSDSPCAPGNHPDGIDCGLIGPLPAGCGTTAVEMKTWGGVKAMYRK